MIWGWAMPATVMAMAAMIVIHTPRLTAIMPATAATAFTISALAGAGTTVSGIPAMAIMYSTTMAAATIWVTTTAVIGGIVANVGIATTAADMMAMAVMTGADVMTIEGTDVVTGAIAITTQHPVQTNQSLGRSAMAVGATSGQDARVAKTPEPWTMAIGAIRATAATDAGMGEVAVAVVAKTIAAMPYRSLSRKISDGRALTVAEIGLDAQGVVATAPACSNPMAHRKTQACRNHQHGSVMRNRLHGRVLIRPARAKNRIVCRIKTAPSCFGE